MRVGGQFIAQKKGDLEAELELARVAVARLGGADAHLVEVTLSQLQDNRYLVCSTKIASSPARYPRRSGMPFKHPLL